VTPRNLEDARTDIEHSFDPPLTAAEWDYLVQEGYAQEIADGYEGAIVGAISAVEKGRRAFGRTAAASHEYRPRFLYSRFAKERREALALLVAEEAAGRKDVQTFRHEVLGGELLTFAGVAEWVEGMAAADGRPTHYVTAPIPEERQLGEPMALSEAPQSGRLELLHYLIEGSDWIHKKPTKAGGVLDRLRLLSETVARVFDWWPAQGSVFVLTGLPPERASVRMSVKTSVVMPALSRVDLEIDPTTSPSEVAQVYRTIQTDVLGGRQFRSQGEKHLNMAVFVHRHRPRPTWAKLMKAWNQEHPEWAYEDWRRFQRDAKAAHERLIEPFPWAAPMNAALSLTCSSDEGDES
jgi:hypothetical protein